MINHTFTRSFHFTVLLSAVLLFSSLLSPAKEQKGIYDTDRVITVKGDKQFFPFEFINELGEADGFSVELLREALRRANIKYTLYLDDWNKVQNQLFSKDIDMAVGMIYSDERAKKVRFGIPHYMISYNIVCREDNEYHDMESLRGRHVIVQNNDRAHNYLKSTGLTDDIIIVDKISDGIRKLASGEGDALISFDVTASYFVRKGHFKNLKIHATNIEPEKYSMVVNLDNEALLYTLNSVLYQMKVDGAYDKIYYKWFGIYEKNKVYKAVWYIVIALCTIILLSGIFIILLNRKVIVTSRSLKKKNEESERLKREFLESMSHEIRTPLNAIVGFSSLMLDTLEQEKRLEFFHYIKMNNNLLLQLVNDILDLSLIQSDAMEFHKTKFLISTMLNEISANSCDGLKPDVDLMTDIQYDCILDTDKDRLSQVVTNIVNNAIKFTDTGSITLCSCMEDEDTVCISVKDTGIGIPEDKLGSVFNQFVKINDFSQGTGIGLTISKHIIELLGGRIGVNSTLGMGSEFWILLPINNAKHQNPLV